MAVLIILIILGGGGYYGYQKLFAKSVATRYVTAKVERGALITSLSGTGQVSASSQVDLKTKTSGEVLYVGAMVGQEVKNGALLVSLNAKDALKSVRDAEANLESAKLSLEKLNQPTDALTILQSENSLTQAKESKQASEDGLKKDYDDGFNTVANVFLDLPTIVSGLNSMLLGNNFESNQANIDWYANFGLQFNSANYDKIINYRNGVLKSYNTAKAEYDKSFDDYKNASRLSSTSTIESLILETYDMVKSVANAVKDTNNYIDFIQGVIEQYNYRGTTPTTMTTHQSLLDSYTGQTNGHLLSLLSIKQSIEGAKTGLISADRTIAEKMASLANLTAGADALDIKSQEISIKQKQNALLDAREKLADYSVRAPFGGVIASFTAKKGDSLSSGASVGTIITKQKIATISLNEVDAAKVKTGQKVILTFDAVEDLSITGEVVEVDTLGTTSQGVVSYNVKIGFDVQDERIKPGMSVSASIILDSKPDVLLVSSSAVKSKSGESYVEILVNGAPQQKTIVVGSSNDTMTEIISGLGEEEEIITQKIVAGTAGTSQTTNNSASRSQGSGAGGEMFRMMR